jgi:predicted acyltransferase
MANENMISGSPVSLPASICKDRLVSIDALRGFAMFLILAIDIGGAPIFSTFTKLWGDAFAKAASRQFTYEFAEGLRLCFLAMPMFLFVVGLVLPLSLRNKRAYKEKKDVYRHIVKRALILFVLGLIAGGHLLQLKFTGMPLYNNVLEYISVGYLVCSLLVLNTTVRVQFCVTLALLLLYWALFVCIPVPGWDGEVFSSKMNLAIYVDNLVLGPFHRQGSWQVLATISFIANMLLGVLIGQLMIGSRDSKIKMQRLVVFGFAMLVAGFIWGRFFPIIRSLWTSSYVLVTCGLSTLLLAAFYLLLDVKGHAKWALFFVVLGANSITVYMMAHLFDFKLIGTVFVSGVCRFLPPHAQDFVQAAAALTVIWLIMYWMYCKKTFIKI